MVAVTRQLLGVSLSRTELCALISAVPGAAPTAWRCPVEAGDVAELPAAGAAITAGTAGASATEAAGAGASPLHAAFAALAEALNLPANGSASAQTHCVVPAVALMPSLAEVRAVALPALGEADTRQLLTRNGSRYFRTVSAPFVVAVSAVADGETARVVAATSGALLAQVHAAARAAGFVVGGVVPAESAWAEAATALANTAVADNGASDTGVASSGVAPRDTASARSGAPRAATPRTRSHHLLVCEETQLHLLTLANGSVIGLRRFRRAAHDRDSLLDAARDVAHLRVLGHPTARAEAEAVLQAGGVSTVPMRARSGAPLSFLDSPDHIAAFGAAEAWASSALRLETDGERATRAANRRRRSWRLTAVGAAALVVAAAVHLWGLNRELDAVRAERAALAPQLGSTLVGRTTVDAAFRQLATLDSVQASAPRWSQVLSALSRELPAEAFLTGFRGHADTVSIDGLAVSAARVFDAVERVPMLQGVHASSPVRRETTADGEAFDRFQLAAQLRLTAGGTP